MPRNGDGASDNVVDAGTESLVHGAAEGDVSGHIALLLVQSAE